MDMIDVEGRLVGRATFPPKEAGKKARTVFQILGNGSSGLLNLRTIADMSKGGFDGDIGEFVKVRCSVKDFNGSTQYTYWGPEDDSKRVDGLGVLFGPGGFDKAKSSHSGSPANGKASSLGL